MIERMIRGAVGRLRPKTTTFRFPPLSWIQKKKLKHQQDGTLNEVEIGNLRVWYQHPYELMYTYRALFVDEMYRFTSPTANPVILDCGSNIGLSVLYFKSIYPHAVIHAFEPDKENFAVLQRNLKANNLAGVYATQCAIWKESGQVSFSVENSEASRISSEGLESVQASTLSAILAQHPSVQFLKLDIEGAEYEVLLESADSLGKVENLFVEYHGAVGESYKLGEILSLLSASGFAVYVNHATDHLRQPFHQCSSGFRYDVQLHLFCYRTAG